LPCKHINLPQPLNNLLRVPGIPRTNGRMPSNAPCSPFSVLRFLYITVDRFRWGTPARRPKSPIRWKKFLPAG
jgi:hypothetical protein